MRIVIVGGGKVGELLCEELAAEGKDILLIDRNERVIENIIDKADVTGIVGNGANYDILMDADVAQSDIFISVTEMDEINMISAIMAKKMGADFTIARIRNPENYHSFAFMEESLGIRLVINPELEAAKKIFSELEFPSALNVDSFANNLVYVVTVMVEEESSLIDQNLVMFRKRFPNLLVCIIERNGDVIIPKGDSDIRAGDRIHVTGTTKELERFYQSLGEHHRRVKSVLIIGAGRITHYLLSMLSHTGSHVKVIESDPDKARAISCQYPDVTVIRGDGSDKQVLDEERIGNYEAVISLTGIDEENVFISLYASRQGVKKTVTKINRTQILAALGELGLQNILTPKRLIANRIIRFVRAIENSMGSNVETLYRLADDRAESLQFSVKADSKVIGIPLKDLPLEPNILIAYIIRDNKPIFPGGEDTIQAQDRVIIITLGKGYNDIDDMLKS